MSEENLNTPEAVPGASDVSAPEGGGTEASVSLEDISKTLGKDFKDTESALKSIKDTFSYVGSQAQFKTQVNDLAGKLGTDEGGVLKALEALAGTAEPKAEAKTETPSGDSVPRSQYEQDRFFDRNQNLEALKDVLVPLKNSQPDVSWNDFIKQPHIEQLVEQNKLYSESQSKRSVVESNPKIGAASDKMTEARTAQKEGNEPAARKSAVGAVIDLLD